MIAFTGTPISEAERNTRQVFGDYIDIYDHTRAVKDGATVPVYYEPRHIPVDLPDDIDTELIDERADEATAGPVAPGRCVYPEGAGGQAPAPGDRGAPAADRAGDAQGHPLPGSRAR